MAKIGKNYQHWAWQRAAPGRIWIVTRFTEGANLAGKKHWMYFGQKGKEKWTDCFTANPLILEEVLMVAKSEALNPPQCDLECRSYVCDPN